MISNRVDMDNSQMVLVEQHNEIKNFGMNFGIDKYLFNLATSVKLNSSINFTDYNQLFNNELLAFLNTNYVLSPKVETRLWKKLNLSYMGNFEWTTTKQVDAATDLNQSSFNISQSISIPIPFYKGLYMRVNGRHLYTQRQFVNTINYLFVYGFLRYTYKKWNTDFELSITNIGNIKKFETYNINANMKNLNSYELRGRMALLRAIFYFSKK